MFNHGGTQEVGNVVAKINSGSPKYHLAGKVWRHEAEVERAVGSHAGGLNRTQGGLLILS